MKILQPKTGDEQPAKVPITIKTPKLVLIHSDRIINGNKAFAHTVSRIASRLSGQRVTVNEADIADTLNEGTPLRELYSPYVESGAFETDEEFDDCYKRHCNIFNDEGSELMEPHDGTQELLLTLRALGIPVIVLTNAREATWLFLRKTKNGTPSRHVHRQYTRVHPVRHLYQGAK